MASRHPLWEKRLAEAEGESLLQRGPILDDHHETFGVTPLDGEPDIILKMPSESYMPLAVTVCLAVVLAGLLIHLWALAGAALIAGIIAVIGWLWPREEAGEVTQ